MARSIAALSNVAIVSRVNTFWWRIISTKYKSISTVRGVAQSGSRVGIRTQVWTTSAFTTRLGFDRVGAAQRSRIDCVMMESNKNSRGGECEVVLSGKEDSYGGIIIDLSRNVALEKVDEFSVVLERSLKEWREKKYRGIWMKVPIEKADLVGCAVRQGFEFHHAETSYLMLCQWLPENEPNVLPPNASHQVGVGAFVYDKEKEKVLVIQEKQGPLKGKGVWKMPTGLVCQGEDVSEAAVREVQEETGVCATFTAVLAMRQAHGFAFGKSDMFFVVACNVESGESDKDLKPQEEEIEAASWISLDEFMNIEFMKSRPLYAQIMKMCGSFANGTYKGISGSKLASGSDREDLLLFGEEALLLDDDDKKHGDKADSWIGL